jgi:hypothetical protein
MTVLSRLPVTPNALARHHEAHLIEVARVINALTDEQRDRLGIFGHDPAQTYDRVDRTFTKLAEVLDAGHPGIDAKWFANALAQAAVPDEFRTSRSVAVDGTDVETWGALHGDAVTVELDGEAAETQLMDDGEGPKPKKPARKAKVLAVGTDGRNQYTVDRDARAGHRSATNSRPAGPYVGYELHLGVGTGGRNPRRGRAHQTRDGRQAATLGGNDQNQVAPSHLRRASACDIPHGPPARSAVEPRAGPQVRRIRTAGLIARAPP